MIRRTIENSMLAVAAAVALVLTGCQSNAGSSAETEELKEQIARLEQQISELEQRKSVSDANIDGSTQSQEDRSAADSQMQESDAGDGSEPPQENDTGVGNGQPPQENDTGVGNGQPPQENDTGAGTGQLPQNNTGVGNEQSPQNDTSVGTSQLPQNDTSIGSSHQSHHSAVDSGNAATGLTTYTMEELSAMVEAFTAKAGAAVPGGNDAQDMEQFFALKQEEKQIDDALDYHEDELEYLYKNGSLTREEYKKQERELELLEDKLDDMEDQLEYRFGIDD